MPASRNAGFTVGVDTEAFWKDDQVDMARSSSNSTVYRNFKMWNKAEYARLWVDSNNGN